MNGYSSHTYLWLKAAGRSYAEATQTTIDGEVARLLRPWA
jgi:hypothetical protein